MTQQLYARKCTACGKGMNAGFVLDDGAEYYCGERCLQTVMTLEAWEDLYDDEGGNYFTEWDEPDDYTGYAYTEDGQEVEL